MYNSLYQKRISGKAPRGFVLAENSFAQVAPVRSLVTEPDGTVKYYSCRVLHREDGPAVIGVLDREDGPAVVGGRTTNGQYEWWRSGVRHRDDGPAVIELIYSYEFGHGRVYEWWRNGVRQKVQSGDGILYYLKDSKIVLTELPAGRRVIERDEESRFEVADGNDLDDSPTLEAYDGYLERGECMNMLYAEPQSTFDTFNPAQVGEVDDD
jgi:hypothetical protein